MPASPIRSGYPRFWPEPLPALTIWSGLLPRPSVKTPELIGSALLLYCACSTEPSPLPLRITPPPALAPPG